MPTPAFPTLVFEEAFASGPLVTTPTFTSIDPTYVHTLDITRGRSPESERFNPGTAEAMLLNADRRFDNSYTSGPYYPNLIPNKRTRWRATFDGTTYDLFEGFANRHNPEYELGDQEHASHGATDGFKMLARAKLAGMAARPVELSSARVTAIADFIGWPSSRRAISTGGAVLAAQDISSQRALDALFDVDLTENGRMFIDGAGLLTFLSRGDIQTATRQTTSQFTFGDGNSASEVPYAAISVDNSETVLWNSVTVNHPTYASITVEDATSIAAHGRLTKDRYVLDATEAGMRATAEWLLAIGKDPVQRITGLTIRPTYTDANWPNMLFATVFGVRLADRITVKRRPEVGSVFSQECWVESIRHTVTPLDWTVQIGTTYAPAAVAYATWGSGLWGTGKWGY